MEDLLEYMTVAESDGDAAAAELVGSDTVTRVLQWLFGSLLVVALLVSLLYYHRTALFPTPKLR